MQTIQNRLASLRYLFRPLALTFLGIILLSLGATSLLIWSDRTFAISPLVTVLTLQFIPLVLRATILLLAGVGFFIWGIWYLSDAVVVPVHEQEFAANKMVLGYREQAPPRIAVLSGGAGMLILSNLSDHVREITCIPPPQDPIEYYYRASSMFQHHHNIHYVVGTPEAPRVYAELDDGTIMNVMHIDNQEHLAARHVRHLFLSTDAHPKSRQETLALPGTGDGMVQTSPVATLALPVTRPALDAIRNADTIILGPGSLFESILPNLLIDDLRTALQQSKARKIFICNLMTEPGLTTGFSVGDHIRQIKQYGGFTPDYVLVNVQRIEQEVQQVYAAAQQLPVHLTPEEYEETAVPTSENVVRHQLVVEDSIVVEADLASSVVRYNASVNKAGESWAVRVLRHDPDKLIDALLKLLQRNY